MAAVFMDTPIEALCKRVTSGSTPLRSRADYYDGGTIDWYKTGELDDWYLDPAGERITARALEETSVKLFPANTVLMAMYGDGKTITNMGMLRFPAATNQACCAMLVDEEKCDPRYFFYALKGRRDLLLKVASGGAQRNLSGKLIKEFQLPVPPFPDQQRIAGILSAYDELIENSQRRIKILETMARALYREWFVHFRFPGHENHPRVASSLGEIPQGWEVKALADVCSRITDGSHFSPKTVEDGYPMASVKDMHDWGIHIEGCRRITSDDFDNLVRNDCKPLKNDVLIAKDGSYLKHTFVVGEEQDLVILSSIAMLRPNDAIHPNVLCLALRDPVTKARMKGIVSGVAIPRIVLKDFRKFQILVPPQVVQAEWARIVDPMLEMCRKLVAQTENLRRTRDLLLPRLLSGQIDVQRI